MMTSASPQTRHTTAIHPRLSLVALWAMWSFPKMELEQFDQALAAINKGLRLDKKCLELHKLGKLVGPWMLMMSRQGG